MNFPPSFISSIHHAPGFNEADFIEAHEAAHAITSIRLNPAKVLSKSLPAYLHQNIGQQVPWSSYGYYLSERPSFTLDPLFHAGAYYVQEASSMFLEEAVRQTVDLTSDLKVLDLCAAPGGKSTLLQSIISPGSLLVSNEVIKSRAGILADNISRWGAANVVVTNNDPKDFARLPSFFDVLVIDAPCSGSGLFRKDPQAMDEWSLNNVALCSQRQQRILADALPTLKPGGTLIYSTCSYSVEEDEGILDWLLANYDLTTIQLQIPPHWNIVESISPQQKAHGYRFYPGKVKGEGFFIAAFHLNSNAAAIKAIAPKQKALAATKQETEILMPYINHPGKYVYQKLGDDVIAIPAHLQEAIMILQQALYLRKAGVLLGSVIRKDFIPHHQYALSNLPSAILPAVQVSREDALQYLRRNDLSVEGNSLGWAFVQYERLVLGLVKILKGRINNYYPKEWRILNK